MLSNDGNIFVYSEHNGMPSCFYQDSVEKDNRAFISPTPTFFYLEERLVSPKQEYHTHLIFFDPLYGEDKQQM